MDNYLRVESKVEDSTIHPSIFKTRDLKKWIEHSPCHTIINDKKFTCFPLQVCVF